MEESVFEVSGRKKGRLISNGNGFFYRIKDKSSATKWKLICKNVKCRGRATLLNPGGEKKIKQNSPHTCEPDLIYYEKESLREDILKRCEKEITPNSEIFREECAKR